MRDFIDEPNSNISWQRVEEPVFILDHIDGPVIHFSDGQMHWLTLCERWRVWRGQETAASLQKKLRPNLTLLIRLGG